MNRFERISKSRFLDSKQSTEKIFFAERWPKKKKSGPKQWTAKKSVSREFRFRTESASEKNLLWNKSSSSLPMKIKWSTFRVNLCRHWDLNLWRSDSTCLLMIDKSQCVFDIALTISLTSNYVLPSGRLPTSKLSVHRVDFRSFLSNARSTTTTIQLIKKIDKQTLVIKSGHGSNVL